MPSPRNKRRPALEVSASHQLVLGNGVSVRQEARREYDQAKTKLAQARQEIVKFKTEDCPAFEAWLQRNFAETLTELRELNNQYRDKAQLMREVEDICHHEQLPIGEAYRLALHRRAHPEESPPPHAQGNAGTESEGGAYRGFADFDQAFADMFGANPPPGLKPPGVSPKPKVNPRVKELYRILVRKLHPDAQGQMTPEKTEWWHEVQEAYAAADAERLEMILDLSQMADGSIAAHTNVALLHRITAQFKAILRAVKQELTDCRREPAWKFNQNSRHSIIEQRIRDEMQQDRRRLREMNHEADILLRQWASMPVSKDSVAPRPRKGKAQRKSGGHNAQLLF